MSDVRIEGRAVIREILDERRARAVLPNGKVIVVYARKNDLVPDLAVGQERMVLLSLCDLSKGQLAQASPPPLLPTGAIAAS